MKALFFLTVLLGGPSGPDVVPGMDKAPGDWAYTTIKDLGAGEAGWIDQKAVVMDHEGYCWLVPESKVRATPEKAGSLIRVSRDSKGYNLELHARYEWQIVRRADIDPGVIPVMKWRAKLPKLPTSENGEKLSNPL